MEHFPDAPLSTSLRWEPGRTAVIQVAGDIDDHTAVQLGDAIARSQEHDPATIVVDLAEVTFFSCAAVSELLLARSRSAAELAIVRPARPVTRILGILGLDTRLRPAGA